ncbi:helicase POLQ-like [Pieris rapae]|uniref:helicase POLQ-like n=1 Tax=Pieris rapae TaxID=64459 RepID=UPI001E27C87B|nr:helicase POLQ-like [Pieris rapae]
MNNNRKLYCTPSTPKRRRLGNSKIARLTQTRGSVKHNVNTSKRIQIRENCDSPPLPCNQVEYLCDSDCNSSVCSDIPCSPGVLETYNILDNIDNWKSFVDSKPREDSLSISVAEDVFKESFHSNIDSNNHLIDDKQKTDQYKEDVENSFNIINQSICNNDNDHFETKDSFLLDIRESGIIAKNYPTNETEPKNNQINNFYGLPLITKGLFKSYRNIEKFYDWQEECLNLNAIKKRQNLIYALPTSGGKTLVAEVLMLREVLVRKRNSLFILPFVAIVQEKIWALSPFAIQLDFLVEEYAGGKGHLPPKKRRRKNSIYVATIEKGLALIRNLIELDRLDEIGLIVVDELHLIGEPGRGGTLETLLSTVIFAKKGIQIVGMSATIGNLPDLAGFLQADVFQRQFRPVELTEYVKLGDMLYKIVWSSGDMELVPDRKLAFDYTEAGYRMDPDLVGGLVSEVVPKDSCLVFCPTKRNCQSVATLLCNMQRSDMLSHRVQDRIALQSALRTEGASADLVRCVRAGVAYHHAGLASDERCLLEQAFRAGVISVLCCTSTLAAGVNLPARRVILRAPLVGREFISLSSYRQMVGRAGRAGVCDAGESIIICGAREWPQLKNVLSGGLPPVTSQLRPTIASLLISAIALNLANDVRGLKEFLGCTFLAKTELSLNIEELCEENLIALLKSGALEFVGKTGQTTDMINNDLKLVVSKLGQAAIKSCLELEIARQFLEDIHHASQSLVLLGSLHLLYLVTGDTVVRPDYRHYYSLYCGFDEEASQTARVLGITERYAVRMITGKPITNIPERVLHRFYIALMLRDLWRLTPVADVADKYGVSRGLVQAALTSACAFASSAERLCGELSPLWPYKALFHDLAVRLRTCSMPELEQLMELPAVRKARAMQLYRAGFRRVEEVARASEESLSSAVQHLSRTAAQHLISAARMMLIEKVENLRADAEEVMDELKM